MSILKNIKTEFEKLQATLCTIHPVYNTFSEVSSGFLNLLNLIQQYESPDMGNFNVWHMGESEYILMDDLMIGAFWFYTENRTNDLFKCTDFMVAAELESLYTANTQQGCEEDTQQQFVYDELVKLMNSENTGSQMQIELK